MTTRKPLIERRREHFESLFTRSEAGVARRHLYLAWDFTVASAQPRGPHAAHPRPRFAALGDTNLPT